MSKGKETIVLGGGCFWCTEAVFSELSGVLSAEPGYSGGTVPNPSYEQVCTGTTGHAEVVRITYDPEAISTRRILEVFFATHDPTTVNRQGDDIGTQYRSVIFWCTEEQKVEAEKIIEEMRDENLFPGPIVTAVEKFREFYPAEDYHRNYFARNGSQPYCRAVISPKLAKFRKKFGTELKNKGT